MKEIFEEPGIKIIIIECEDVITTSGGEDGIDLPDMPIG